LMIGMVDEVHEILVATTEALEVVEAVIVVEEEVAVVVSEAAVVDSEADETMVVEDTR